MKNKFKKIVASALAVVMGVAALAVPAYAANATSNPLAIIDQTKDGQATFTIHKYDFTNAKKDGVWKDDSFVSTGWQESYVEEALGAGVVRAGDDDDESKLGNGQSSYGYAIKGVEFTIMNVAEITTFTESANDAHPAYNLTRVLYGFDKQTTRELLKAIGLEEGARSYDTDAAARAGKLKTTSWYYTSDVLNDALSAALEEDSTKVKNALEAYMAVQTQANRTTVMRETNEYGVSTATGLTLGLYLVVETKVPEMVTNTTAPFFVSIPMTTKTGGTDGEGADSAFPEGGHEWNYDVHVYPKNETGIPSLEKTVRESKEDTGTWEDVSGVIHDGYEHVATGSAGDIMEYQIVSTLPNITSNATSLTVYKFTDTIAAGLDYVKYDGAKGGVTIEIYSDRACTNLITTWLPSDTGANKMFDVTYSNENRVMTININENGLAKINGYRYGSNELDYVPDTSAAYANYTMRITYTAKVNSDASSVLGEKGNQNKVVLEWRRSNQDYYDTLEDDCHVYTFGIDLTKLFSDTDSAAAAEKFNHVKFKIWNDTDKYWVTATPADSNGIYYVNGHVTAEADATIFTPVTYNGSNFGRIMLRGLEDDTYIITECETADGYTLLKDSITVVIKTDKTDSLCDIYSGKDADTLGVVQNDARYDGTQPKEPIQFPGYLTDNEKETANYPQAHLDHYLLTVSATVDGNDVTMNPDTDTTAPTGKNSANALVPLTVVNQQGFDIPQTGERGMILFTVCGAALMATSLLVVLLAGKKKEDEEEENA